MTIKTVVYKRDGEPLPLPPSKGLIGLSSSSSTPHIIPPDDDDDYYNTATTITNNNNNNTGFANALDISPSPPAPPVSNYATTITPSPTPIAVAATTTATTPVAIEQLNAEQLQTDEQKKKE